MSITKRDRLLVNLMDNELKCISTRQVGMLPMFNCNGTAVNRRLKKIVEYGLLQREMIEIIGNMYVYYSKWDKRLTREIEHSLAITDVYIALLRAEYEIIEFIVEKGIRYKANGKEKMIIPDIMVCARDKEGKLRGWFIEICLDKKVDYIIKKYNCYKTYYIPQREKKTRARELLIIGDVEGGISGDIWLLECYFKSL